MSLAAASCSLASSRSCFSCSMTCVCFGRDSFGPLAFAFGFFTALFLVVAIVIPRADYYAVGLEASRLSRLVSAANLCQGAPRKNQLFDDRRMTRLSLVYSCLQSIFIRQKRSSPGLSIEQPVVKKLSLQKRASLLPASCHTRRKARCAGLGICAVRFASKRTSMSLFRNTLWLRS